MVTTLTPAPGIRFVKFDIERCIRIVTEDGEHCLPIDSRQCEEILAPIALDGSLSIGDHQRLNLITIEIGGDSYAAMDTIDGELYQLAANAESDDYSHTFSEGSYGGVVWRVVGYLSNHPGDALQLNSGNDEAGVRAVLGAFQSLLSPAPAPSPTRVVVELSDGGLVGIHSRQPVEAIVVCFDHEDESEERVSEQAQWFKENSGVSAAIWHHRDNATEEMQAFFAKAAERSTAPS
ncbi:hypothetical protein PVE_R2G0573 [Pseudomonas veronii 1YdBTEX2]|uniref:Uncharacterized protein n=1 Tax=Pseudomonas veronii 1YdBTEX2 TaxID=1295141 RepID=A0A1D3K8B0_PSEVE|nr:hypothetical protein PVE_R2G0573 [Pseudomonas veronii 1YdBTEX2]